MIIATSIIAFVLLLLISFSFYRNYKFNQLSHNELIALQRGYRKTINQMSYSKRNSFLGKSIIKAHNKVNQRTLKLEKSLGRSTKGGGNYVSYL